jgi:NAD(P)-dependent dehydrogenase (short-subunit alcohol dehydrogenase family)
MKEVIVITDASSGFGALTARALARAGHIVYASMRGINGRNAPQVEDVRRYATEHRVDLQAVELDVLSQDSCDTAIQTIIARNGHLDVLVHNAGHMAFGPAEAFTPEQLAELYDINLLGTQRVNRAALPHLRTRRQGLVVWVSSSSVRGGTLPFLSPYFAAKAAMDSLAVSYAGELARWGIETSIVVPGAFTKGTNHFAHAGAPADTSRAIEYADGTYAGIPSPTNVQSAIGGPQFTGSTDTRESYEPGNEIRRGALLSWRLVPITRPSVSLAGRTRARRG